MSGGDHNQASRLCPECHHQHTLTGCVGDPSPSDLWAGVDVAGCDCDDEARRDHWADL